MADSSLSQSDARLKAADAAYTAARNKVVNSSSTRRYNILIAEGGANPKSPDYPLYLKYKAEYDALVAAVPVASAAYEAAQENYKQVYAQADSDLPSKPAATETTPATEASTPPQSQVTPAPTQNPGPAEALSEAAGPQATAFEPKSINPNSDPNAAGPPVAIPIAPAPAPATLDIRSRNDDTLPPLPAAQAPATSDDPAVASQGIPIRDDDGTLSSIRKNPETGELYNAAGLPVGTDSVAQQGTPTEDDAAIAKLDEESRKEAEERYDNLPTDASSTAGSVDQLRTTGVAGVQRNIRQQEDWRLRLMLAPKANYLYNTASQGDILYPLKSTNGVVFPYTPQIAQNYRANYDPSDITHTNYKQYFYKNSSVEELTITAEFTAQDTTEALYMLAVMHFFKSVTKMFYGKDANPRAGTPPPLCYLLGYGQYQFSDHPLLISGFSYTLPNDVDYIRAGSTTQWAGQNVGAYGDKSRGFTGASSPGRDRVFNSGLQQGGISSTPPTSSLSNSAATYVPTKIQFTISALPVATRAEVSNTFSLKEYASGNLLKKGFW